MIAGRLSAQVREEDTVGRLGGDEFVIALWDIGQPRDAAAVAAKLIKAVSMPYMIDGQCVSVTTSAGIANYPDHGVDATTLMKRADEALYAAKRAGKNAFRMADQPEATALG
jgi:two-component system cell cycle response regulator